MTEKYCSKCGKTKLFSEFHKNKASKDGLQSRCIACSREGVYAYRKDKPDKARKAKAAYRKNNLEKVLKTDRKNRINYRKTKPEKILADRAKRRATKLQATPSWFEADKVAMIYRKAIEWNMTVDHVVPLQGETVCGLHCWANLQLLESSLNSSKGNREWPDH